MRIKCRKIIRYFNTDNIELIRVYDNIKNGRLDGEYKSWYLDGTLSYQYYFNSDVKEVEYEN